MDFLSWMERKKTRGEENRELRFFSRFARFIVEREIFSSLLNRKNNGTRVRDLATGSKTKILALVTASENRVSLTKVVALVDFFFFFI